MTFGLYCNAARVNLEQSKVFVRIDHGFLEACFVWPNLA